tara:strand:- start:281 stop:499 length:219 start_codon:yes stop_codon:yes gene_type:complete
MVILWFAYTATIAVPIGQPENASMLAHTYWVEDSSMSNLLTGWMHYVWNMIVDVAVLIWVVVVVMISDLLME